MKLVIATVTTAAAFLILDLIWLGYIMRDFYRAQLGPLMADPINIPAAVAFYAVFTVGVAAFVLAPALEKESWRYALVWGALFGFVAYATYDLTNLATLRGWSLPLTLVDMAWGAVITAVASTVGVWVAQRFA